MPSLTHSTLPSPLKKCGSMPSLTHSTLPRRSTSMELWQCIYSTIAQCTLLSLQEQSKAVPKWRSVGTWRAKNGLGVNRDTPMQISRKVGKLGRSTITIALSSLQIAYGLLSTVSWRHAGSGGAALQGSGTNERAKLWAGGDNQSLNKDSPTVSWLQQKLQHHTTASVTKERELHPSQKKGKR